MLLHRESTPWEAASSGARTVPGEGGWAKGSTLVAGLPGAPMICVSQPEVCGQTATSTPGNMAPVGTSPHTWAERGFGRGPGGVNSLGFRVEKRKYHIISSLLSPSAESPSLSQCTQDRDRESCLPATRDVNEESEENNNIDPQEQSQASSGSSILGRRVLSVHAKVSSRKNKKGCKEKKNVKFKKKFQKKNASKSCKKKNKKETSA